MMSILKYTISFLFFWGAISTVRAQSGGSAWIPSTLRIGGSAGSLAYLIFSDTRNYFEASADVDLNRFLLVYEYGFNQYKLNEPTYSYSNSADYMRVGLDVDFMYGSKDGNVGFFGVRYGWTTFEDRLSYNTRAVIESETGWPDTREESSNTDAYAHWFEMDAGLKVRIVGPFFMGFTARYKFLVKVHSNGELKPYWVPGFGKHVNSDSWGLNYYFYYTIPFRKKVISEKKKKKEKKENDF